MFDSVVIVGGGPVGLYTALLLQDKYPYAKIVLFEKRAHYTRSHRVKIDQLELTQPRLILQSTIPIKEVEEQFKKRLSDVQVIQKEIKCIDDISIMVPDAQTIIFADGAHSKARELYLQGECSRMNHFSNALKNFDDVRTHRHILQHSSSHQPFFELFKVVNIP